MKTPLLHAATLNPSPEPSAKNSDFNLRRVLFCRGIRSRLFQQNRSISAGHIRQKSPLNSLPARRKANVHENRPRQINPPPLFPHCSRSNILANRSYSQPIGRLHQPRRKAATGYQFQANVLLQGPKQSPSRSDQYGNSGNHHIGD